ncbi:MAG TPA: biotin/lipoyl-containing protein [Rhodopila sp.]|uniref:biotin/lipoyl-containing protein n=1 Tax=Rhodopila sp. TaxID=2480087 RepID=UPI002B874E4D|nr:biotin/lipoyl-containing protein [Rhodopila sp.]HVY15346.1 biotin/lipoyl-containing protein [Rhodopila sp.]
MPGRISALTMPKLGLTMKEGSVAVWHVAPGGGVVEGQPVADIETSKITASHDAPVSGTLRRQVAAVGEVLPVGALIGVVADADVPDAAIDSFIAAFQPEELV